MLTRPYWLSALCVVMTGAMGEVPELLECQFTDSGGFTRQDDAWVQSTLVLPRSFSLQRESNQLTPSSVARPINAYEGNIECFLDHSDTQDADVETCAGGYGQSFFFNHRTLSGGLAELLGSGLGDDTPDDVKVAIFVCSERR